MNYLTILAIAVAGLSLWIVSSIIQIRSDIKRINVNLNKIAKQVNVPDTITDELKRLILEGKKIEATKNIELLRGLD